jgi:signal transduction histidine kinase
VRREVAKIDARMRELLDISQPRVFHVSQCLLNDLVSGVVLLASHQVNSINNHYGRQLSIEFIDATSEPILLDVDPLRIEDAVLNLVLNAIESIEGDGRVTVRLCRMTKFQAAEEALIEVSDTGCGIPTQNRRRIFDPLFTTKSNGTGLGLAAVRRTAAAYHGRISFKTKLGRGSKFVFALPLRPLFPDMTKNPK